jgi:GntR family transcriptional regulator
MLRDKSVPLYYQIEEIPPKALLPSEDALKDEYQVSRITVRQALSLLEQEGLIVRRRGKGTFVSERTRVVESAKLTGSMEDLISMGIQTSAKVLDLNLIEPPENIRKHLKLDRKTQVLRIEKIRFVEEKPFSHVLNYLPSDIGKKVDRDKLTVKPLLMILEEDLGIKTGEAIQTVEATIADAQVAPLLDIRVGDPLLKAERTVFDRAQRPIEHVSVHYRADKYCYKVRLKRERSKNYVGWEAA